MNKRRIASLIGIGGLVIGAACGEVTQSAEASTSSSASASVPADIFGIQPLDNNASAGSVILTFDDGPDIYDPLLLAELNLLHLHAIFFVIGDKITAQTKAIIKAEVASGDLVENHTWDHSDWTGASTGTAPLTDAQVTAELSETQAAIVAAGAPIPTLARAPFGDLTGQYAVDAADLGLQMVQPFEVNAAYSPRVVDSNDWTGIPAAQIVTDVTEGSDGMPGIDGGAIVGFHDAAPYSCASESATTGSVSDRQHMVGEWQSPLCMDVLNTIVALPGIVKYMNANDLGDTTSVPTDATGGIIGSPPWNWLPTP